MLNDSKLKQLVERAWKDRLFVLPYDDDWLISSGYWIYRVGTRYPKTIAKLEELIGCRPAQNGAWNRGEAESCPNLISTWEKFSLDYHYDGINDKLDYSPFIYEIGGRTKARVLRDSKRVVLVNDAFIKPFAGVFVLPTERTLHGHRHGPVLLYSGPKLPLEGLIMPIAPSGYYSADLDRLVLGEVS